jgi:short subunit fatty acids transporter
MPPHRYTSNRILQRRAVPSRHSNRSVGLTAELRAAEADKPNRVYNAVMAAVIPFSQTVFLWQSMVVALVLIVVRRPPVKMR